jgi:hypothetical protein
LRSPSLAAKTDDAQHVRDDLEMIWSWWDGGARLRNVLAAFDPSHQSLELLRRLGAQIGVVHSAQLLGDGK